ncbi:MAG TPA: hypothetical protein VFV87_06360 [Pirellulaceae bacterium]|nr:hypothetical protein [Pirellulaceae bacterium]
MATTDPLFPDSALQPAAEPMEDAHAAPGEDVVQAATQAEAAATGEATAEEAPQPRRGGCMLVALGLVAGVIVLGGVAGGAWWMLSGGSSAEPSTAAASDKPTAPEPAGPPPALTFAEAPTAKETTAAAPTLASRIERIPGLVSAYETELLTAVETAPADVIVTASGRQSVDSVSEIPRHERWQIEFPPGNTIESYTRQLEYFKMEIGLIGGSSEIEYLVNISDPVPTVRKGPASEEQRLYLIWQRGSMREADEQLATRARVSSAGKIFAHFCPEALETDLAQREDAFAKQNGTERIRKTIFGVKANEFGGFQFYVIDQKAVE